MSFLWTFPFLMCIFCFVQTVFTPQELALTWAAPYLIRFPPLTLPLLIPLYLRKNLCPSPEESSYTDNNPKLPKDGRICEITLSGDGMSVMEHTGTRIGDMKQR